MLGDREPIGAGEPTYPERATSWIGWSVVQIVVDAFEPVGVIGIALRLKIVRRGEELCDHAGIGRALLQHRLEKGQAPGTRFPSEQLMIELIDPHFRGLVGTRDCLGDFRQRLTLTDQTRPHL